MAEDLEVSRVAERVAHTEERAEERFKRTGPVSGTATAPDGAIVVTVGPGGLLRRVKISPAALRSGPDAVARQVVDLADKATRRAGDAMYRSLAPVLGPGADEQLRSLGYEELPEDELDDEQPFQGLGRQP